jgi:hypothetical protein
VDAHGRPQLLPKVAAALNQVHDWAFDKVLGKPLPLIGAPFAGLKDGPKDKPRWLIDQVNKVVADRNQLTLCPVSEKLKQALDGAPAGGLVLPTETTPFSLRVT